jgi:hypothetical protein
MSSPPVGKRSRDPFKQRDVVRAMKSAEKAGLAIGGVEVVTKDGVTIRILAKEHAGSGIGHKPNDTPENVIANL